MRLRNAVVTAFVAFAVISGMPAVAVAQATSASTSKLPADPWPRDLSIPSAAVLVYQPQINKWVDNQIDFRAAVAIKPTGAKDETFGVVFATARTQVDKVARMVVFENLKITKADFPTLPNHGAKYSAELQTRFGKDLKTISLDRLEASLAAAGVKPPSVPVNNAPPQVIVSYSPAILVPIDGAPVLKPVPNHSRAKRVINTRALILQGGIGNGYYIHVYDGWLASTSIEGPWTQAMPGPFMQREMDAIAQELAKTGTVDLLDGGPKATPKPSLANGVPTIYTAQGPTELIVFSGQPDFVPIVGTQLLWASNTTNDVLIDTANNNYYVLLAGRWFTLIRTHRTLDLRRQQCIAAGLREDPGALACGRRVAFGRRNAAGAGGGDRQHDSADRDGAAEKRPEVHAELRRSATILADPRHAAHLRDEFVGAAHSGEPEQLLRGHRRRLVHSGASDRTVERSRPRCPRLSTPFPRPRRCITSRT